MLSTPLQCCAVFTVLRTERKMARRFAKVSEEEIKTAFFYPSDLVNTKTTIPLRAGEERSIYTSTLRVSVYIHHYSPPLRGIVVYYSQCEKRPFLTLIWRLQNGQFFIVVSFPTISCFWVRLLHKTTLVWFYSKIPQAAGRFPLVRNLP